MKPLPAWAAELSTLYESGAASQFVLHGNVHDRLVLPGDAGPHLGTLAQFLQAVLLPAFDVILTYDLGNGIRVERGSKRFHEWPSAPPEKRLPHAPRPAVETLSHYFRYLANLRGLGHADVHVALILTDAQLVCPAVQGGVHYDLSALAILMREWGASPPFVDHPLATFLLTESLNDLHPLVATSPRVARIRVPLPDPDALEQGLGVLAPAHPRALAHYAEDLSIPAAQLTGATMGSVESMLRTREHRGDSLGAADLVELKKDLVERDAGGLITFIESTDTLEDYRGHDAVKTWLRQDLELWSQGDLEAMPMGYLLSGPVGTGKTFLVRCLAGEARVPVVKINNFRDKWIGSTEANLERIFRLLRALGRCIVFVDEADQALGRRGGGSGDSGLSGRIYSMIAQEMSRTANRGRVLWVLASSRPDLIEVDLKRPGRIDVKIPLFPTTEAAEGFALLRALCARRGLDIEETAFEGLRHSIPDLLTPGAAESLAVKVYRESKTNDLEPLAALEQCLTGYRNPVPEHVIAAQIRLAVAESSDNDFVPARILAEYAP